MTSPEPNLSDLLGPVEDGLERMRGVLADQIAESSGAVRDMTAHVGRFRGKQLRAGLVLLTGEATGNATDEHATIAAIVEMIHLATLVHDDILDGADVRRRVACVHSRWDNQTAVLLGDFLYARAFALSTELSSRLCSRILAEATRRICVGEIEQATRRYDFETSDEDYERIAGAKTATLYAAACELGARYPGGHEDTGVSMRLFGQEVGLAFQIVDDCLDVVGDAEIVGKNVGTDVEDGKVTLPVLHAYRTANDATRAAIRDAYTQQDLPASAGSPVTTGGAARVEHLRSVVDLRPGVDYALARAEALVAGALDRLRPLPNTPARRALETLGEFVLQRSF